MLKAVEGADGEGKAAFVTAALREGRQPAQIGLDQLHLRSSGGRKPPDARRRPLQHRARPIDADHLVSRANQRKQQAPGAAGQIEERLQARLASLVRDAQIEADVSAATAVLEVVEGWIFEGFDAAGFFVFPREAIRRRRWRMHERLSIRPPW